MLKRVVTIYYKVECDNCSKTRIIMTTLQKDAIVFLKVRNWNIIKNNKRGNWKDDTYKYYCPECKEGFN